MMCSLIHFSIISEIFCFISLVMVLTLGDERERRALVFQSGAVMQLTFGVTAPVDIPNKTVALSVCLQSNFFLPTNASQLDYFYKIQQQQGRDTRDLHLETPYEQLEDAFDDNGMHGPHCTLRSICQAAATPMDRTHSLLEEMLHLILTPSEGVGVHRIYLEAERLGQDLGDCSSAYPLCSESPLDYFTTPLH